MAHRQHGQGINSTAGGSFGAGGQALPGGGPAPPGYGGPGLPGPTLGFPSGNPGQTTLGKHRGLDPIAGGNPQEGGPMGWLERNQEIGAAILGTGAEVYGAYKEGQQADRDREEEQRRYEEQLRREDEYRERRGQAYQRILDSRKKY